MYELHLPGEPEYRAAHDTIGSRGSKIKYLSYRLAAVLVTID